jgi:tetratricopeptide (TPR) repeat protein
VVNYYFSPEEKEFNASLDAWELLLKMGFHENALYREGNTIRLFCPLHKDQIRRSLIIYTDTNTYKCQYTGCLGHKGGNLLEFYAAYMGCEVSEAMARIAHQGESQADFVERAERLILQGQLVEALPLLQKAVQLDPKNEITRCRLAALYLELGDKEAGYREYLQAAEHYGVRGEFDKMLHIYNILLIIRPDDIKVRKQLSYLFSRLKREDEAIAQLKWVVDRHVRKGQLQDAIEMCKRMIELSPEYPDSHRILGEIYLRLGSTFEAIEELTTATRHYIRENNLKKAKETVDLGLRYAPGNAGLKDLKTRIEKAIELQAMVQEAKDERELAFEAWLSELKRAVGVAEEEPSTPVAQETTPEAPPQPQSVSDDSGSGHSKVRGTILQGTFTSLAAQPTRPPTEEKSPAVPLPKLSPADPRILFFKDNLMGRTQEELESLRRHLVNMFEEVQAGVQEGFCSEFEARVIREFYAAFCIALDAIRSKSGGKASSA